MGLNYYPEEKDVFCSKTNINIYGFSESQFFLLKADFRTSPQGPLPTLLNCYDEMQALGVFFTISFPNHWDFGLERAILIMTMIDDPNNHVQHFVVY